MFTFFKYGKDKSLKNDLIAGITVALVLIPQSLAYAKLAGLPPQYGLYASVIPTIMAALFGSSPQLSTGPVAVLSLMTFSAVSLVAVPGSPEFVSYAVLMSLMLGGMLLTFGFLKLGNLISFLSHPVIYGFTNAAAIIIAATQLGSFTGIQGIAHTHYFATVGEILMKIPTQLHAPTFALALFSLVTLLILGKFARKVPGALVVVVLGSVATWYLKLPVEVLGQVPLGLANFKLPELNIPIIQALFYPALVMAIVGFTESSSIAQAVAIKTKKHFDSNKELIGQGAANLAGSLNQGFAVSGSFSRTALNYTSGATTRLSGVVTGLVVLITILFFTDFLYYLPLPVLSAIIIFSVLGLINLKKIKHIWSMNKFDGFAAVTTFLATLYFAPRLETGVLIGVVLSLVYFFYKNSHPRIAFLSLYKDHYYHDSKTFHLDECTNIAVVRLDAPLFFANTVYFEEEVIKYLANHKTISDIIFVATGINEIDGSGIKILEELLDSLKENNKNMYMCSTKANVQDMLERTGFVNKLGKKNLSPTTKDAVELVIKSVNKTHKHLDKEHCPLLKYTLAPVDSLRLHKSTKEIAAYFYERLFTKPRKR